MSRNVSSAQLITLCVEFFGGEASARVPRSGVSPYADAAVSLGLAGSGRPAAEATGNLVARVLSNVSCEIESLVVVVEV